jgi:polyphosphate kinase
MARISLDDPRYYINRHLSWLAFNRRVLEEAFDPSNPVLERVKFLAITASNLDEFVEVRVAGMLQQSEHGLGEAGPDGLGADDELERVGFQLHEFVDQQYRCWNEVLMPALRAKDIRVLTIDSLDDEQRRKLERIYTRKLEPILTPVTIDPSHPFPHVINKALCIAFLLKKRRSSAPPVLGILTVPRALPRLIRVPDHGRSIDYVFLPALIIQHASRLYRGYQILSASAFRVTRNSNLYLHEEESRDLLETVDTQIHQRRKGDAVRLEIEANADPEIIDRLRARFHLREWQIFRNRGPVNLSRLFYLYDQVSRPELKFPPFVSREVQLPSNTSALFESLRNSPILLHHPYESYSTVVQFLQSAARDPHVLSIKQTLYRTSEDSPIARALMDAAQTKEVTVVVELKARFDEAANIHWARSLQEAGVQVCHGVVGLKTHCKLALITRNDEDGEIRRYAHLGTGNYNPSTARFYTDLSLLTGEKEITAAVHNVFDYLTAYSERLHYRPLLVAPIDMAKTCVALIDRETAHARKGRPARIIAKVNALLDKEIIKALYRASQAGVEIDLIVRGACALRPGVHGVSNRIRVRSLIGRFLEHSRIFLFLNGEQPEVYMGSADWMPRNLYGRVEVMLQVKEPQLCDRICNEILSAYLSDTRKARHLHGDGSYSLPARRPGQRNGSRFSSQCFFIDLAEGRRTIDDLPIKLNIPFGIEPEQREAPPKQMAVAAAS